MRILGQLERKSGPSQQERLASLTQQCEELQEQLASRQEALATTEATVSHLQGELESSKAVIEEQVAVKAEADRPGIVAEVNMEPKALIPTKCTESVR